MSQTPLADEIARISRGEFQRYLDQFRPLEGDLISELDKPTVGKSIDAAAADATRARASLERMRERYGADVTPFQAAAEARQNALSSTLGQLSAANNAVLADRDNRRQSLAGLLNVGQGIRQQALGNFSSAANMEGARASADQANRAAYAQQKAANRSSAIQSVASLGAAALMAFAL